MKGVFYMRKREKYSSDFKLQVVKEYLNSDKSQIDICSEYNISQSAFSRWVKKYEESGYDDNVFNSKKGRPKSIISDISKVPSYESAGIVRNDSNNSNDSALDLSIMNVFFLKKNYVMHEDEINF
jgi:transposase-like protein